MSKRQRHEPTQDERVERHGSLAAFVAGECCNYHKAAGLCLALGRECELLAPTAGKQRWRSPRSLGAHYVPQVLPEPCEPFGMAQVRRALLAFKRARELQETSGDGRCSWFDRALGPLCPAHIHYLGKESVGGKRTRGGGAGGGRRRATGKVHKRTRPRRVVRR